MGSGRELRVQGSGFRVQGWGFRVGGSGLRAVFRGGGRRWGVGPPVADSEQLGSDVARWLHL